uniref:Uncharacterized protein n=1 Tax=Prolemur simus TaxID=1328070 RepID=A0A8C8ZYV9_PROSS
MDYPSLRGLQRQSLVLPPRGPGRIAGSLSLRRLLGSPTRTRTPSSSRWTPRIGDWRPPGSGPPVGSPEQTHGDRCGYAAGCPGMGAGQPAGAVGLALPGGARWPPIGRHYSPPLSPHPLATSGQPNRLRRSAGVYKRAQEPRQAPHCASASLGAQLSSPPP